MAFLIAVNISSVRSGGCGSSIGDIIGAGRLGMENRLRNADQSGSFRNLNGRLSPENMHLGVSFGFD